MSAEDLPQAIPVQGRSLETHQALPPWPRPTADAHPAAGGRDRQHDVDRRHDGTQRVVVNVDICLPEHRRRQEPRDGLVAAENPPADIISCLHFVQHSDQQQRHHDNCDGNGNFCGGHRKRKLDLVIGRPEAALRSAAAATSGPTSRASCFRLLEGVLVRSVRPPGHRLHRSVAGRKLPGSADQR